MSLGKVIMHEELSLFDASWKLQAQAQLPTVQTFSTNIAVDQSGGAPQVSNNQLGTASTAGIAIAGAVGLLVLAVVSLVVIKKVQLHRSSEQSEKVLTEPPVPIVAEPF